MNLDSIYTDLIAEQSRNTANKHHLEAPTVTLKGRNPSCGDEITLELRVKDGVIEDAAFVGDGCAISQASANIMIDLIKGKTVAEAQKLAATFTGMIKGQVTDEDSLDQLEDAQAFKDIAHMPARVKCATLGWHTLDEVLGKENK